MAAEKVKVVLPGRILEDRSLQGRRSHRHPTSRMVTSGENTAKRTFRTAGSPGEVELHHFVFVVVSNLYTVSYDVLSNLYEIHRVNYT
jgi:hypothetical protein